jgi:signal transduction histidine kinase/CHASE3 domain sensor protein/ActR/RegA family two-component response regulator
MSDASGGQRLGTRWIDRSMRTKGLVVIAVPIAILFVVLGSTSWFTHVDNRAQDVASSSRQVVDAATMLENSLLSAESGVSDYLLTGDRSFQGPSARAEDGVRSQLGQLAALTLDTGPGATWGLAIQHDTDRLVAALDRLKLEPPSAASSTTVHTLLQSVQVQTSKLRDDISSLIGEENAVIASQQSDIHTSNIVLPAIVIAAVVLALAGGVMVSQLFTTGVVRRLRRLERATEELERGETPVAVPSGRDEIGRLSARLLDTTAQLRERAEERDRARKELENILTASPVVSLRYDVGTQRFTYASPNIDRLLGISAEEAVSAPAGIIERIHPESASQVRDAMAGSRSEGERLEILLRFRRDPTSEDWREAEVVYTLETGPDGELQGLVAYIVDVSERHAAQRAADERRFLLESIFHASPDTIVVRDITGQVVLGSSPLADVIGTTDAPPDAVAIATDATDAGDRASGDEAAGNGAPGPLAHDIDRAVLDELIARCVAGEQSPDPVVTTGRLPGGDLRTYETRARPVFDHTGRVTGTVTISRDVTRRVRLEQSLRHASVGAERASQAKSEFLSRMSHELRTPLNAILGFAQLLELDELPENQASSVDQIQVAGRHLLSLINEVLDISRIEAGRVSLSTEPVEISEVLDEVTTLLGPVAETAGIELSVDSNGSRVLRVRADRQRLLQVLLNLGSNAVKYNSRGGSVAFCTAVGDSGRVRFEVRDTGPGIPHEQQDQLFVPFSRLGAERSAVEGTGVGLALSKQLVEVMGGTIGVDSVPGHGSTFWIELLPADAPVTDERPLPDTVGSAPSRSEVRASAELDGAGARRSDASSGAAPHVAPGAGGSGRGVVVLQIEDNPSNSALVEQVLAKRPGVRLVSAGEGRTGLELARQHRPDLVLLDLHLPDLPGDELLHRLKAVPELADTKVVVVSADATPSRIREMLDLGVEGYLTKPVDVAALLRLVDYEIGAKQSEPG